VDPIEIWAREQPKVELHRHLEGAIPYETLWQLQKEGILSTKYKSLADLRKALSATTPLKNLQDALDMFGVYQSAFQNYDVVSRVTRDVIIQSANEGITTLELRLSPGYMAEPKGLNLDKIMSHAVAAKNEVVAQLNNKIKVGLVMIHSRNYGAQKGLETAELAKRWRHEIVGFDLAAGEDNPPVEAFVETLKMVHELKIPLTVHIGEGTSISNIQKAFELYPPMKRLGHATKIIEDEKLMQRCIKENIMIEACPTSNVISNSAKSYKEHPLVHWVKIGLPASINSDDPTLFDSDLVDEWVHGIKDMGFSKEDLLKMNKTALQHCFI